MNGGMEMICEKCTSEMILRSSVNGDFFFCPNQRSCGQKTITKVDNSSLSTSFRTQSIQSHQLRQGRLSKKDKDAEFYWKGEMMMQDIAFGELGGGCD